MQRRTNVGPGQPEWTQIDAVVLMFGRLLTDLGLKRKGLGFYAIRHTFETIAGESRDQVAVNASMGYDPGDMASLYRERVGDERPWYRVLDLSNRPVPAGEEKRIEE